MCEVLDKVENRGIAKGIAQGKAEGLAEGEIKGEIKGENKIVLLMKKLCDHNRFDDLKRASESKEYRTQLMKEFNIS